MNPCYFSEDIKFLIKSILASAIGKGIYILLTNLLLAASSIYSGLFVVPITTTLSLSKVLAPSNYTKNSVFILLTASISWSPLTLNILSTSSTNITLGYINLAIENKVFIKRSDSPTHFETKDEDDILKNVAFNYPAIAFPIKVLPVPGGPNNNIPFDGFLKPLKISGLFNGYIIVSKIKSFTCFKPIISSHLVSGLFNSISCSI